jgi:ribosomal-protein-serine acetyltransferase
MSLVIPTSREGLEIRQLSQTDAERHFAVIDAERDQLRRWLPWPDHTRTVRDVQGFIALSLTEWQVKQRLGCALWFEGEIIGGIGIVQTNFPNAQATLGYWLAASQQGRGHITLAVKALTNYCFTEMPVHRVEILAAVNNLPSRAVADRAGYVLDGVLRSACQLHGEFHDVAVYSRLRPEWEGR